jgi:outer membrane protein
MNWRSGIAAALAACLPVVAAAQAPKIGFVNTERVFREAAPAKRAQQKLEREFSARNAELAKLEKQGRDLQVELEKDSVTLPEAQRREKERILADVSRNFQRLQREIREDLNLRRNEELAQVQERATRAINQIAESEKFDLVVQEAVFASSRIDITDKVIKALADK